MATEVGHWHADVLGLKSDMCIEVESKVSISDLRAEFKNKTAKHYLYGSGNGQSTPNYFYVIVPEDMAEKTVEIIKEKNSKAGVLSVTEKGQEAKHWHDSMITVSHRPTRLHTMPPTRHLLQTAQMRMSSELCGLYYRAHGLYADMSQAFVHEMSQVTMAANRQAGKLDFEELDAIDTIAREMAESILEEVWEDLEDEGKERWRIAATRFIEIQQKTSLGDNNGPILH